jgi:hypothetical protein
MKLIRNSLALQDKLDLFVFLQKSIGMCLFIYGHRCLSGKAELFRTEKFTSYFA